MVLLAMLVVAVPTAAAQTPLSDQYTTDESVGATAGDVSGTAAVQVKKASKASTDSLPFTGGQIALIAGLGLALVALGIVGVTTTRRRGSSAIA
jgi:hypothetical protein